MGSFDVLPSAPGVNARGAVVRVAGTVTVAGAVAVVDTPSTLCTGSSAALTGASQTLLASNVNSLGRTIFNNQGTDSANLYVRLFAGAATTANANFRMSPNAYWEVPFRYTGEIRGISDAATGTAQMGEFTA